MAKRPRKQVRKSRSAIKAQKTREYLRTAGFTEGEKRRYLRLSERERELYRGFLEAEKKATARQIRASRRRAFKARRENTYFERDIEFRDVGPRAVLSKYFKVPPYFYDIDEDVLRGQINHLFQEMARRHKNVRLWGGGIIARLPDESLESDRADIDSYREMFAYKQNFEPALQQMQFEILAQHGGYRHKNKAGQGRGYTSVIEILGLFVSVYLNANPQKKNN